MYEIKLSTTIKDIEIEKGKKIINEIRLPKEEIYKVAFNEGYEKGKKEGIEIGKNEAKNEIKYIREKFQQIIEKVLKEKENIINSYEPIILKIIKTIAKKVIEKELTTDPSIILNVIKKTLNEIKEEKNLIIKINKNDLEEIKKREEEWGKIIQEIPNIRLISDEKISQGGCIIETPTQTIDATIETKLNKIDELLWMKK